jgi:uncharacterized phage protein (TIGR01671 family)
MRKIKFRVWDKDSGQMFYIPSIQFGFLGSGDAEDGYPCFYGLRGHSFTDQGGHVFKKENMVIQQYTGLKDIDEKEIYEGDILKWATSLLENFKYESPIIVEFIDGCFTIAGEAVGQYDAGFFEVIGNIYENPELIKTEV